MGWPPLADRSSQCNDVRSIAAVKGGWEKVELCHIKSYLGRKHEIYFELSRQIQRQRQKQ